MIDTEFLKGLARFNLVLSKRVTSNYTGARKSIAQGKGIIFKDHRIYAPGDDYRAIDWRVFARTDDLMIKNYEEEKNLIVHIIVDRSKSMDFGKKFDYAAMLGVGHAYLAMQTNDKFQFSTFSETIEVFQSKRGMSQLMSMIDYMNELKLHGQTDLLGTAQQYHKLIGSRALVIIISDFLVPIDTIQEALYYFAGHEVKIIRILDEKERFPQMEGDFKLQDAESGIEVRSFLSPQSRQAYLHRLEQHSSELQQTCLKQGVEFHEVSTDRPIFDVFYELFRT